MPNLRRSKAASPPSTLRPLKKLRFDREAPFSHYRDDPADGSAWATSCTIVPLNRTGNLTIKALDIRGGALPEVDVELYQNGRRVEVPRDKVPYGSYKMRLASRGFQIHTGDILIDEPYFFNRVEFRSGDTGRAERTELAGTVVSQIAKDLWIKAAPLRGNG